MDAKERILSLRLNGKAKRHPAFAKQIGVTCSGFRMNKGGFENDKDGYVVIRKPSEGDPGDR